MRQLTKTELRRKSEIHPDLQEVAERARAKQDFFYVCGARDEKAQEDAFATGASTVHYPNSKHNKSRLPPFQSDAVDVAPVKIINGVVTPIWKDKETFYKIYQAFQEASKELGIKIRSGADFDGDGNLTNDHFKDLPHHELG